MKTRIGWMLAAVVGLVIIVGIILEGGSRAGGTSPSLWECGYQNGRGWVELRGAVTASSEQEARRAAARQGRVTWAQAICFERPPWQEASYSELAARLDRVERGLLADLEDLWDQIDSNPPVSVAVEASPSGHGHSHGLDELVSHSHGAQKAAYDAIKSHLWYCHGPHNYGQRCEGSLHYLPY